MKSLQRSCGKNCHFVYLLVLASLGAGLVSCVSPPSGSKTTLTRSTEVSSSETSLSEDQKTLEELRASIPAEKRAENDQLKTILNLTGEVKDHPSLIREKFSKQTQKMRDRHRKDSQKARDTYNKIEKKTREAFYDKLKKERDDAKKKKMSRDESKEFFDNQEQRRKDFQGDERDKRNEFNADMKTKDDDFFTMMREKNNEFNEQMRDYTRRYNDWQKAKNKSSSTFSNPTDAAQMPMFQPIDPKTGESVPPGSQQLNNPQKPTTSQQPIQQLKTSDDGK